MKAANATPQPRTCQEFRYHCALPHKKGAGGESSLTTLPQSSFATVATRRRGEQSLALHRPQAHPTSNIIPFDPINKGEARGSSSVCVRSSRTDLPSRGPPHSENTGEMAKTCGAFP
jgi:hypothetical protein